MRNIIKKKPVSNEELKKLGKGNEFINFILLTGLRRTEVLAAIKNWNGEIDYVDIKTKNSGKDKNRVYLIKSAQESLRRLQARNINSVDAIYKSITRYTKRKLGYSLPPHSFRAKFATTLIENGVDLVSVQHLMNHKDISTTSKYISLSENMLKTALETLEYGNTIEGMTKLQMRAEILRLRAVIMKMENE